MSDLKSFFQMFYLLDYCYPQCKKDDLGAFLSCISPELWTDGMPIDKAILSDWKKKFGNIKLSKHNLKKITIDFLVQYEEDFGFSFYQVKEYLPTCDEEVIELAIERGERHIKELGKTEDHLEKNDLEIF